MPIKKDSPETLFGAMQVAVTHLPTEQQASGALVVRLMQALRDYRDEFYYDLELFDMAEAHFVQGLQIHKPERLHTAWMQIACRDAAMNMYHFGMSLEALRQRYGEVTNWRNKDRAKILRDADNGFRHTFPAAKYVRHAVGHAVELFSTAQKLKNNSFKAGGMFYYNIVGRTFCMTINGELVSLELSQTTHIKLHEYLISMFNAFEPIASCAIDSQSKPN